MPAASSALVLTQTAWPSTRSADGGSIGHGGVEIPARRETPPGPEVLVPPAPLRPGARRQARPPWPPRAAPLRRRSRRRAGRRPRAPRPAPRGARGRPAQPGEDESSRSDRAVARRRPRARACAGVSDEGDPSVRARGCSPSAGLASARHVDGRPFEQESRLGRRRRREQAEDQGRGESHGRILTAAAAAPTNAQVRRRSSSVWSSYCGMSRAKSATAASTSSQSSRTGRRRPAVTISERRSRPNSSSRSLTASVTPSV